MIALAFLWHQHQPYYPDDVAGVNPMPWVRLHGVKDYTGMALHLREFPEMACTINLVPSLLVQIQAYVEGGATDRFLEMSRRPADGLTEGDALFLLDNFFHANTDHMIRPLPRFFELLERRGLQRKSAREALRRFRDRDLRDLQTLFNLAWVHPLVIAGDADLQELVKKGAKFTEGDKNWLLDRHLDILKQIVPLHRDLAGGGQIELTTTPFYHPILPLLLDKHHAREALPEVRLPRYAGGYPEDAEEHLRRAVELHERTFGHRPRGMWPAEGSVCQSMIPLVAGHGIRWIATDEEILSQSTQGFVGRDGHGQVRNPDHMYRPYRVQESECELGIVFRDHVLSDRIGFYYQRSDPAAAAEDFVRELHHIDRMVGGGAEPALVTVILDGENCWEHYPGGGVPFLRELYRRCCQERNIRPARIGDFLEEHPPRDTLPRLFAGSWIAHNFSIWIGHEEDNTAWDVLHHAREHLQERCRENRLPAEQLRRAWDEIYIAEGSDWYWWYGEDHSSSQDDLFDYLFRKHLRNVYELFGDNPPPELNQRIKRRIGRKLYTPPRSFLEVTVNGKVTYFEWLGAGRYSPHNERGTMAQVSAGPIKEIHFGFDLANLLVRIDFDVPARQAFADFDEVRIGFVKPANWEIRLRKRPEAGKEVVALDAQLFHNGKLEEIPRGRRLEAASDRIVETAVSFALLNVQVGQPVQFFVDVLEGGQSRDRAPRDGTIHLTCPSADFERMMWQV